MTQENKIKLWYFNALMQSDKALTAGRFGAARQWMYTARYWRARL